MADITMCLKQDCPIKSSCFRTTARPDRWQSYAIFIECEAPDYDMFLDPIEDFEQ